MIVRFTGGPLDGLQREMESRHIRQTLTARPWEPTGPRSEVASIAPEDYGYLREGAPEMYDARAWWAGDILLCIEYRYREAA